MQKSPGREIIEYAQFVLPIFALFAVFFIFPFAQGVVFSFSDWTGVSQESSFVGLRNYRQAFQDRDFGGSIVFTLVYSAIMMISVNVFGIILAILLTRSLRSAEPLRAVLFAPYILNLVTVGFIWQFIFGRLFTSLYQETGFALFGISWLGSAEVVPVTVAIVKTWQSVGYFMILYIAGLQMIPGEIFESARMDGSRGWNLFRHITLPMLMPSVTISVFLSLINGMRVFPLILTLTEGGPGKASMSIAMYLYTVGFNRQQFGYASALTVLFVVMTLMVSLVQLRFFKRREVQQ